MSLSKIPFIIGLVLSSHVAYTSPTPIPKQGERKPEPLRIVPFTIFGKLISWTLGAIEVAAIVADNTPGSSISQHILAVLLIGKGARNLHITPLSALGTLLAVCGGFIRFSCFRTLGKHFTFDITIQENHRLITNGPYGVVRHPSYAAGFTMLAGVICFHGSRGSWLRESDILNKTSGQILVAMLVMIVIVAPTYILRKRLELEDIALKKQFGKEWDEWAKKVPNWLIPGIY